MNQDTFTPNSVLARNALINLVGLVLPIFIGILAIPFTIKGLTNEGFGIFSIAWVIIGYFSILDFGISRATTKFVAETLSKKRDKEVSSIIWTASAINIFFGILGMIILIMITPYLVENILNISAHFIKQTKLSFYLAACSIPVILFSTNLRGVLGAAQRFDLVNLILIPVGILSFIFPALSYPFDLNLFSVIALIIITRFVATFFYLYFCIKVFPAIKTRPSIKRDVLRRLIFYGGWVTITNIISPILVYMDRFFIGSILSVSVVAYYTAPYDTTSRLRVLPIAIMRTLFPEFSALSDQNEDARVESLFGRSVKYILLPIGVLTVILIFYAPEILRLWLGQQFMEEATTVLRLLSFGIFINSLAYIPFNMLQGIGRPDLTAKFHLIELTIHLILLWYLTRYFGINGAAMAWVIRVTIDFILLYRWSARIYPIILLSFRKNRIWHELLLLVILSVVIFLVKQLVGSFFTQLIFLIAFLSVFAVIVWHFVLDNSEKSAINQYSQNLFHTRFLS